jgi:hypothetical protein
MLNILIFFKDKPRKSIKELRRAHWRKGGKRIAKMPSFSYRFLHYSSLCTSYVGNSNNANDFLMNRVFVELCLLFFISHLLINKRLTRSLRNLLVLNKVILCELSKLVKTAAKKPVLDGFSTTVFPNRRILILFANLILFDGSWTWKYHKP